MNWCHDDYFNSQKIKIFNNRIELGSFFLYVSTDKIYNGNNKIFLLTWKSVISTSRMKGCILKEAATRSRKNSQRWFVENNWKELLEERLLLVIYDSTMEKDSLWRAEWIEGWIYTSRAWFLYSSFMERNLLYVSFLSVGCNYKTFEKFLFAKTDVSFSFVTFRPLCLVLIEFLVVFKFKFKFLEKILLLYYVSKYFSCLIK